MLWAGLILILVVFILVWQFAPAIQRWLANVFIDIIVLVLTFAAGWLLGRFGTLIVGIVVGAYSSVCLTSAMWYVMGGKKRGVVEENNKKAASKKEVFEDGSQV